MKYTMFQETEKVIRQRKLYLCRSKMQIFMKRAFDIGASMFCLASLFPFYIFYYPLCIALYRGRQIRKKFLGRHAAVFELCYIEPMAADVKKPKKAPVSKPGRNRKNRGSYDKVRRFLRTVSHILNHYPAFLAILRGNMSFVGPMPFETSVYDSLKRWHHLRFSVRPGLTGPWFFKKSASEEMTQDIWLDLKYIRESNLKKDLRLIKNTISELFLLR